MAEPQLTWLEQSLIVSAFTTLAGSFVQPAANASVQANVGITRWMAVRQILFVETAGFMQVAAIVDDTHVTLVNLGYIINAVPGTTIPVGARVVPGGPGGPSGDIIQATLDSSSLAVSAGDCVCSAGAATFTVTKATAATLGKAGIVAGIALSSASPGGLITYQKGNFVEPSITGLAANAPGAVRCNPTTGRCERVSSLTPFVDYQVGAVDNMGRLGVGFGIGAFSSAAPSPTVFSGAKLTSLGANYFSAPGNTSGNTLASGSTVVILFTWDAAAPANVCNLWGNWQTTTLNGWVIRYDNTVAGGTMTLSVLSNGTAITTTVNLGNPVQGINCIVLTATSSTALAWSMNGGSVSTTTLGGALPSSLSGDTDMIGGQNAYGHGWDQGGVIACARLSRSASNAELQAWSGCVYPTAVQTRFALPSALTADAACTMDLNFARDWNGSASTVTSHGSSPVTYTKTGSPALTTISEAWYVGSQLSTFFRDTYSPVAQSLYDWVDSHANIKFTAPAAQPQIGVAYIDTDPTYSASEGLGLYVDGAWSQQIPSSPASENDGAVHWHWAQLGTWTAAPAAHAVDVVGGAQAGTASGTQYNSVVPGGFIAGLVVSNAQSFDTSTPAARLVPVGDSITCGFATVPTENAWPELVRQDFPGGVTVHAFGNRTMYADRNNINAYAQAIVTRAQACQAGGRKIVWLALGYNDYANNLWTPTAFATSYGQLLDAIHSLDSSIEVWLQRPIPSNNDSTANAGGYTLLNFDAAIAGLTSGRIWLNYVDTSSWSIALSDGIHPTPSGYASMRTYIRAALGYVPKLMSVDFTSAPLGAMANATFASTYGLSFARASAATVQTGASTIDATPANDVARIGSVGAAWGRGLVIEESRTNLVLNSRAVHLWANAGSGDTYTNGAITGVDGSTAVDRVQVSSGGYSKYQNFSNTLGIGSAWVIQGVAGTTYQVNDFNAASNAKGGSATSSWQRVTLPQYSATDIVAADGRDLTANGGVAAGARDNGIDFAQFEAGAFATEAIVTTSGSATRAADQLWIASVTSLLSSGRLGMYFKAVMKGGLSQYTTNLPIWYIDANNQAYVTTAGAVVVIIGGVTQTLNATPASWNAQDTLELWVEAGGGSLSTIAKCCVNGGAVTTIGSNGTPLGVISSSGPMSMLTTSSLQVSCWVQQIQFYASGQRPAGF